jgi:phosphatidylserine/phosphatidylglycerophosphate/cardiolipin synthase-like enzyme
MSETSIIIEIPVEILHTVFRVEKEDPLKPLMDVMKSSKMIESNSQSVHRLDALSRSSSSISKINEFSTPVMRDLWKGKYWTMGEKSLSLDNDITGSIHQLEPIQRLDLNKPEGEVKDLAAPFLGWLAGESKIDRKEILGHVRLESLKSRSEVIFLRTKISQKEDRVGRKFWVYEEGPFKQLIGDHIDKEPGFEMDVHEVAEDVHEWSYSPEIKALHEFKNKRNDKKALEILDSIYDEIKQDKRPRLDWVKQAVGFRQDMWDVAQEVIRSSKNKAIILTSFSNSKFSDDVAELLAEALENSSTEILLSFGEPDRGRSPGDIQNTEKYIHKLATDKRFNLKGGVSPKSSHAKIIISDTGMVFICSCNLFSGSMESGVLESGLHIKDIQCAKSILEVFKEEEWVPQKMATDVDMIYSNLEEIQQTTVTQLDIYKSKITKIKNDINKGKSKYSTYPKLERMLRNIAERPVWSLIRTLEHRPFMVDCIERFDNRIVMGSDGLRSNGLDKATIRRIDERASKNGSTVHVWWGRHAPNSKPFDEIDKRGRIEAKNRLNELRDLSNKGRKWNLIPRYNVEPMETHAKMFIVDDFRLMITSDNTLSFGDTESERGDAGELGIMIDHPRLAKQTRGSMELWLPKDAKIPYDSMRWRSLLAEEVSLQTQNSTQKIPLISALDSMIERIEYNEYLRIAWEQEIEAKVNSDELTILNIFSKGCMLGTYSIVKSQKASKIMYKLEREHLTKAAISLVGKSMWGKNQSSSKGHQNNDFIPGLQTLFETQEKSSINKMMDEALLLALSEYNSKSGKREHFILQGNRKYWFVPPNTLKMKFKIKRVHFYLEKERGRIIETLSDYFGFPLKLQWPIPEMQNNQFELDPEQEITPEIWSAAFIHYMKDPSKFEWVSDVVIHMNNYHDRLKLGPGKTSKYIINQCSEYLEYERRDIPVKNSLYVRRRSD